jgi:hypothetical protein
VKNKFNTLRKRWLKIEMFAGHSSLSINPYGPMMMVTVTPVGKKWSH